ncbi:MAG: M50 family metallopeptidase [Melioribacter sp.]|uniref:M50 family metallopeptidase n=1 Tax=Rosettibacter primus TaxID=3111523 RepID=UPI00247B7D1F|nr:M50 family metallopeptidase [Melioribacter sp.]
MTSYNKNTFELILLFLLTTISFFVWDSILFFPIKLFVLLLHEISHGIIAIITGGKILALEINFNLGGKCITEDGNQFLIAFAGYPGSFFFGAALFFSTYKPKLKIFILSIIAVIVFLFAINTMNDNLLSFISIIIAFSIFAINKFAPVHIANFIFRVIGLISCVYVIYDIKEDVFNNNNYLSDASLIAEITGLSSTFWGLLWIFISLIGIILLVTFSVRNHKLY